MSQRNVQTAVRDAADAADNITDGIKSAAQSVTENARHAAEAVRQVAGRTADAVHDTYEQTGRAVRESFNRGRDRAVAWEGGFEDCVRDNPKTSLLIAAVFGAVAFAWWKRR